MPPEGGTPIERIFHMKDGTSYSLFPGTSFPSFGCAENPGFNKSCGSIRILGRDDDSEVGRAQFAFLDNMIENIYRYYYIYDKGGSYG
jgi:hypothetical protein